MIKKKHIINALSIKIGIGLFLFILALPYIHEKMLFKYVSPSVIRIVSPSNYNSGGTGFQVKAPSGITYTVTNRHVCSLQEDGFMAAKTTDEGGVITLLKVIKISKKTDLCLLEGIPGFSGLRVAGSAGPDDDIATIGHPLLEHVTMTRGTITNKQEIEMIGAVNLTDKECAEEYGGKNIKLPPIVQFFLGVERACIIKVQTYRTTATIFPGNSGSPLVNIFGNVTGVMFAAKDGQNWGYAVTLEDLKEFLEGK